MRHQETYSRRVINGIRNFTEPRSTDQSAAGEFGKQLAIPIPSQSTAIAAEPIKRLARRPKIVIVNHEAMMHGNPNLN
jgi:hypothetical protein